MQVNIHITLDLPVQNDLLARLTDLMHPTTDGLAALTPAGNGQDRVAGGAQVEPPVLIDAPPTPEPKQERRPHRAVKPATIAAKAAKTAKPDPSGLADSDDDEAVDAVAAAVDLNGPVDPDDDDALGLATPSMTPGEALELGLGKVRAIYAKGHKAPVKALQQTLGIAKFTDIPPTEGHRFLGMVIKLEEQVGMRV